MDYRREAVEYLENYHTLNTSLENLRDEIKELTIDIRSLRAVKYDFIGSKGGTGEPDDRIVNMMIRLDRAKVQYKRTKRTLDRMMETLNRFDNEKPIYSKILRGLFVQGLTEEQVAMANNYSSRHIRRLKNEAIRAFSLSIFGISVIS